MDVIAVENVSKAYDEMPVLQNVNFTFPKGELSIILAPSGRGKTTLFRLLMQLEQPDCGTIHGLANQRFSAVFQEDRLLDHLDAYQNIRLPSIGKKNLPSHTEIAEGMRQMQLFDCQNKVVGALSGGMKRRVAILRALFAPCDILLLDEPFKGLDDATKRSTMHYVKKSIQGKTTLMITHDTQEVAFMNPCTVVTL